MSYLWSTYGLYPVAEYRFAPPRKWRFDWCWPDLNIAVEQEGGIWMRGRHTRGKGYLADMEKYNEAAKLGWRVFRFSPKQIMKGEAQTFMREVIKNAKTNNRTDKEIQ